MCLPARSDLDGGRDGAHGRGGGLVPLRVLRGHEERDLVGEVDGGDQGGNRRVPAWLVETEDVWGESAAVAPGVIGDSR